MVRLHGLRQVEKWKTEARKPYKWKMSELEELVKFWKERLESIIEQYEK